LLASCADEPVAPTEDLVTPSLTPSFGATHADYLKTIPNEGTFWDDCANGGQGEFLDWYGAYDVVFRKVETPSGNDAWKWYLDFYAHPLGMIGVTTEDHWQFYKGEDTGAAIKLHCDPSPCPGGAGNPTGSDKLNFHYSDTEWYENQAGERIRYRIAYHIQMEDGEVVKHERSVWECKYYPARP
jgi:hypothetical protein